MMLYMVQYITNIGIRISSTNSKRLIKKKIHGSKKKNLQNWWQHILANDISKQKTSQTIPN